MAIRSLANSKKYMKEVINMIKILGFQHKQGNFKDANNREVVYNNIILYYVSDCVRDVVGCSVGELKIPFENCKGITGYDYPELPDIINKSVELSYIPVGKYQQLSGIRVIDDKK